MKILVENSLQKIKGKSVLKLGEKKEYKNLYHLEKNSYKHSVEEKDYK